MSLRPLYRVERYFQPQPNFADSDYLPPKHSVETLIETDDLEKAKTVFKDAGVFKEHEDAWRVFIADAKGGWEKRIEDEEKVGIWVYRVFIQEKDREWNQYTGDQGRNTMPPNNGAKRHD